MKEHLQFATVDALAFQKAVDDGLLDINLLFDIIIETDLSTLRYSNDRSLFIIKAVKGPEIDYLKQKAAEFDVPYVEYEYNEMLQLFQSDEWNTPGIM